LKNKQKKAKKLQRKIEYEILEKHRWKRPKIFYL